MAGIATTVSITGLDTAVERLGLLATTGPALLHTAVQDAARLAEARLISATPVRTGRLKAGWRAEVTPEGAEIRNDTPYAAYLVTGTRRMRPNAVLKAEYDALPDQLQHDASARIGELIRDLLRI